MSRSVASKILEQCGTACDLVLLYSTKNETFHDHIVLAHRAMFAVLLPCNKEEGLTEPANQAYSWASISEIRSGRLARARYASA